jgi:hypothetical protein
LKKLQTVLLLAASDMEHAAAAARALEAEADDLPLMRALETAIAVCYTRAFTASSLMTIADAYVPTEPADAELHEFLRIRRYKALPRWPDLRSASRVHRRSRSEWRARVQALCDLADAAEQRAQPSNSRLAQSPQ